MTTLLKCDETHAMYNTMYRRSSKPDVYRASNTSSLITLTITCFFCNQDKKKSFPNSHS